MRTITLQGDPKSTQHIYRSTARTGYSKVYMTAEGKAIKEAYQWEARSQWRDTPLSGDVIISLYFYFKTSHKRDLDNMNKLVLDALTGIVYDDDCQIAELHLYRRSDRENPRIEVQVG